jgi:hypothetical protein
MERPDIKEEDTGMDGEKEHKRAEITRIGVW